MGTDLSHSYVVNGWGFDPCRHNTFYSNKAMNNRREMLQSIRKTDDKYLE